MTSFRANRDTGTAALKNIHNQLQIDEGNSIWTDRSFSWVAHRLRQNFSASSLRRQEVARCDVNATIAVVNDVRAETIHVLQALVSGNATAIGNAWMYNPELRQVISVAAHSMQDETLSADTTELGAYAVLQLCEAELVADTVAELVGGRVALDRPDGAAQRNQPDGMLAVPAQVFIPSGSNPSEFSRASELNAVNDYFANSRFASFGPSTEGICIEVPFDRDRTVLVQLSTNKPHPWLGNGLLVDTFIPGVGDLEKMIAVANRLQQLQMQTVEQGGRLGAWTLKEINGHTNVAWTRFVPNTLFRPGIVLDTAIGEVARAIWVDNLVYPDLPERNAWTVIEARAKTGNYFGFGRAPDVPS